jgi:two-component system sensor histidine kinase HydH
MLQGKIMSLSKHKNNAGAWLGIPPWILLGAVVILVPIFVFWAVDNIKTQREGMILLLTEKGAALIRSLEAGARTGMMGMHGGTFGMQRLLKETAQQPDIVHLIVTDIQGTVIAHSESQKIGQIYGTGLNLETISRSTAIKWRQVTTSRGDKIFEVFRRFSPTHSVSGGHRRRMMDILDHQIPQKSDQISLSPGRIIFVGLDMGPVEATKKEELYHTMFMALILLLIGMAGIFSLFLFQAYRSARVSLTTIKAFSDKVVENMPIGLVALNAEGSIAAFNKTAEQVLHLPPSRVINKSPKDILPQPISGLVDELKGEGGIIDREIDCPREGGKTIPLDVTVFPLKGDANGHLGKVILFRDLTEIQNLKAEVERSRRLASLGRLAAGVAHEIRNPLSSIKGFATYFMDRYKDVPEDQKTAEIMIQEVERLNRVITQLLEFARPMSLHKRPVSMPDIINHSLKMIERKAEEKKIKITVNISPEINEVSLDPDRMNQVLLNLYLNAVEAMPEGGTLTIELFPDRADNGISVVVSDTGIGINAEDAAHIFDPYFTTKTSGTGLGLAIVHRIVQAHAGEIRVDSEPNLGTSVTLNLPGS